MLALKLIPVDKKGIKKDYTVSTVGGLRQTLRYPDILVMEPYAYFCWCKYYLANGMCV